MHACTHTQSRKTEPPTICHPPLILSAHYLLSLTERSHSKPCPSLRKPPLLVTSSGHESTAAKMLATTLLFYLNCNQAEPLWPWLELLDPSLDPQSGYSVSVFVFSSNRSQKITDDSLMVHIQQDTVQFWKTFSLEERISLYLLSKFMSANILQISILHLTGPGCLCSTGGTGKYWWYLWYWECLRVLLVLLVLGNISGLSITGRTGTTREWWQCL